MSIFDFLVHIFNTSTFYNYQSTSLSLSRPMTLPLLVSGVPRLIVSNIWHDTPHQKTCVPAVSPGNLMTNLQQNGYGLTEFHQLFRHLCIRYWASLKMLETVS